MYIIVINDNDVSCKNTNLGRCVFKMYNALNDKRRRRSYQKNKTVVRYGKRE